VVTDPVVPLEIDGLGYCEPPGWRLDRSLTVGRPTASVFVPNDDSATGFVTTLLVDGAKVPVAHTIADLLDAGDAHLRSAAVTLDLVWQREARVGGGEALVRLSLATTAAWPSPVVQLRAAVDRGTTEVARRVVMVVLTADVADADEAIEAAMHLLEGLTDWASTPA
jgi:hypothetical protein